MQTVDDVIHRLIKNIDINKNINLNDLKNEVSRITFEGKVNYVRENVDKPEIIKKIKTYIINTGVDKTITDVQMEITNNEMFAAFFIKDTSKQNIYEKLQLSLIKKVESGCKKLPSYGKNCLYLYENKIENVKSTIGKSIDFIINKNDKNIYIYSKFTKDIGGAQDNQANDAKDFIIKASKYVDNVQDNSYFWFLGDGEYYENKSFQEQIKLYLSDRVSYFNINALLSHLS